MKDDSVVVVGVPHIRSVCGGNVETWKHMVKGKTGAKRITSPAPFLPEINIAAPVPLDVSSQEDAFLRAVE